MFTVKYFYLHVNFLSNILWFAKLLRSYFKFDIKIIILGVNFIFIIKNFYLHVCKLSIKHPIVCQAPPLKF